MNREVGSFGISKGEIDENRDREVDFKLRELNRWHIERGRMIDERRELQRANIQAEFERTGMASMLMAAMATLYTMEHGTAAMRVFEQLASSTSEPSLQEKIQAMGLPIAVIGAVLSAVHVWMETFESGEALVKTTRP